MRSATNGFTLIELLVVIFIIAVVVAATSITLGDNQGKRLENKSKQLVALIELAKEQAIFNTEELGVVFTKESYSFYRLNFDNQEKSVWEPVVNDSLLNKRVLPDGLEFKLKLEGIEVSFRQEEKITPQVFILSDGSVTPFEIRIMDETNRSHSLNVTENGEYDLAALN